MADWTERKEEIAQEIVVRLRGEGDFRAAIFLEGALDEIKDLREDLCIAENSWNFEEGKRIIGERDAALTEVNRLRLKQKLMCHDMKAAMEDIEHRLGRYVAL